jgi:hypothetical protein
MVENDKKNEEEIRRTLKNKLRILIHLNIATCIYLYVYASIYLYFYMVRPVATDSLRQSV